VRSWGPQVSISGSFSFASRDYGEKLNVKYKLLTPFFVLNETAICDADIFRDFSSVVVIADLTS
jgi:hypothetical protein